MQKHSYPSTAVLLLKYFTSRFFSVSSSQLLIPTAIPIFQDKTTKHTIQMCRLAGELFAGGRTLFSTRRGLLDHLIDLLKANINLIDPLRLLIAGGSNLTDQIGDLGDRRNDLLQGRRRRPSDAICYFPRSRGRHRCPFSVFGHRK